MTTPSATAFLPYHCLDDVLQRGPRAAQPAAADVVPGTLYCVTDEGWAVERSTGAAWDRYVARRNAQIFSFDFSDQTAAPPTSSQVRINAAYPYSAATAVYVRLLSNEGRDVYWGLIEPDIGTIVMLQDKNDHTLHVSFSMTAAPIDHTTYIEWPVAWRESGAAALFNNQAILVLKI